MERSDGAGEPDAVDGWECMEGCKGSQVSGSSSGRELDDEVQDEL